MPISEEYLVSYLLRETQQGRLDWRRRSEDDFEGFLARLNGVSLRLARLDTTTESRLWLHLESEEGSALISEPRGFGLWGKRYRSDAERMLAELMTQLEGAVTQQADRRKGSPEDPGLRQAVFRRLLFDTAVSK